MPRIREISTDGMENARSLVCDQVWGPSLHEVRFFVFVEPGFVNVHGCLGWRLAGSEQSK